MNKNNTKRALFLSAVSMFLCIVMLAGSTYAWFTDTVEVKTSRIEAGVLDVELEYTNDAEGGTWVNVEDIDPSLTYAPFFLDADGNKILWEPGVVSYANFKIVNAGNRALQYDFSTIASAFNKVSGTNDNLTQVVKVGVLEHTTAPTLYAREALLDLVKNSSISWTDFTLDSLQDVLLEGGNEDYITLVLYWEPTADDNRWNLQNGKTSTDGEPLFIDVDIKLVATQFEYEKDSIDEEYDAGLKPDKEGVLEALDDGATLRINDGEIALYSAPANVTEYTVPEGVTVIDAYALYGTQVEELTLASTVEVIDERAFDENSTVKKIVLNEGLEVIGNRAFRRTYNLEEIVIPSTVKVIESGAFQASAISGTVTIPEGVTEIGDQAFYGCSNVTKFVLPEGLVTIADSALRATAITEVTIPSTVTYIGAYAFRDNYSLETVNLKCATTPTIGSNAFLRAAGNYPVLTVKVSVEDVYNAIKDLAPLKGYKVACELA